MKTKSIYWHCHIDRQTKSGKSSKAYCAANRISPATYQYWKRKLRPQEHQIVFEEVLRPLQVDGYRTLHIRLPGGAEMWLEAYFPFRHFPFSRPGPGPRAARKELRRGWRSSHAGDHRYGHPPGQATL